MIIESLQGLVEESKSKNLKISDIALIFQVEQTGQSERQILDKMKRSFNIMKEAVKEGLNPDLRSPTGLSGGNANKVKNLINNSKAVGTGLLPNSIANALAVAELNACMGKIVAAPTAGSCGIIPSALITIMEEYETEEDKLIKGLFTAGVIGMVIAKNATVSGAEGGCQAECGSAAAMAAGAVVEIFDGTTEMVANACAFALQNSMGLVCDPIAGLVEIPCIYRNAGGVANAFVAANMALSGMVSVIPADEVIEAMRNVGKLMSPALKETAKGGLAATKTARNITKQIFG